MNKNVKKCPEYLKCPEEVKRRIENIFTWTLEHCPYPESVEDRITWIHDMEKALRHIESESLLLSEITQR